MSKRVLRSTSKADPTLAPADFRPSVDLPSYDPIPDYLLVPDELWVFIISVAELDISDAFQLSTVSKLFSRMVYLSVTSLNLKDEFTIKESFDRDLYPDSRFRDRPDILESFWNLRGTITSEKTFNFFNPQRLPKFVNLSSLILGKKHIINDNALKSLMSLTYLNLMDDDKFISDIGIMNLTNLTELIIFRNKMITNNGLKKLTKLQILNIGRTKNITDAGISHLVSLTSLYLSGRIVAESGPCGYSPHITDNGLSCLTNLTYLSLYENEKITNDGIKYLTKLVSLNLSGNERISDIGLQHLTNITSLNLDGSYNFDDQNSPEYFPRITHIGLLYLPKLTTLSLINNDVINDEDIQYLVNITSLNLSKNVTVTDNGLKHLTSLLSLNLNGNNDSLNFVTGAAFKYLTKLSRLEICLNEVIAESQMKYLINLNSLTIGESGTTDKGLKYLTNLTYLDIVTNERISDTGLKYLSNSLTTIKIPPTDKITVNGLKCLTNLTSLYHRGRNDIYSLWKSLPNLIFLKELDKSNYETYRINYGY